MNRVEAIAQILDGLGVLGFLTKLRDPRKFLPVLAYHRVTESDSRTYSFDEGTISATPFQFERQLKFISRNFTTLSLEGLIQFLDEGRPLPSKPLLITFDDGYRDNYLIAYPLLKKFGLRATFFVASGYVESRELFWWDAVAYLIKSTRQREVVLSYPRPLSFPTADQRQKAAAIASILRLIKSSPGLDMTIFLQNLSLETGLPLPQEEIVTQLIMSWAELIEMNRGGMDIGSHTRSHPVLANISPQKAWEELNHAKKEIEEKIERPVVSFSYPVGGPSSFNEDTKGIARECGYRLGFSYNSGMNVLAQMDPLEIRRLAVENYIPHSYFKASLVAPSLFAKPGGNWRQGLKE